MTRTFFHYRYVLLVLTLGLLFILVILTGCTGGLSPNMSYQGRLTDASGTPLNGNYSFTFRLYDAATAGTSIYTETESIAVTNGLFDTSIGPTTLLADITPDLLAQPLWLEVTIGGETLTPRQRLLGSPYAFTLMPGAVISSTFNTTIPGDRADAVVEVMNTETDVSALPALRVVGNVGLEVADIDGGNGAIYGDRSSTGSNLQIHSNNSVSVFLDDDGDGAGERFYVYGNPISHNCYIDGPSGNLYCTGTKSSIADVNDEKRALYAMESPEVIFEDFGSSKLENGQAGVTIDTLFAATVNLDDYLVFVTPLGDCNGLYVSNKTPAGFEVHELGGGTANITFDYRIVAKRLGYENVRMEIIEQANGVEEVK
jgi:hypothetical protein